MKKTVLLLCFLCTNFIVLGQKNKESSVTDKRYVIEVIEKDIEKFIFENRNKYKLTEERIFEVKRNLKQKENDVYFSKIPKDKLSDLLELEKDGELRKLYFEQNPEHKAFYTFPKFRINNNSNDVCENGDFENQDLSDYIFRRKPFVYYPKISIFCDYDPQTNSFQFFNPSFIPNDFSLNTHATLTAKTDENNNPVFQERLLAENIQISVTNGNSDFAIKLNNNIIPLGNDNNMAVTMTREFTADSPEITFSFNFVCENPLNHDEYDQPRFRARLYNSNNQVISEFCLVADVTNTLMFYNATPDELDAPLIYTDWQCAKLSTGGIHLLPNEEDRVMTLEFLVNDCTQGAHFGTVYIDDICTSGCDNPVFGNLELNFDNPQLGNCPAFPLEICGTYIAPHSAEDPMLYAELDNIELTIIQNGNDVTTLDIPSYLTTFPNGAENQFCFTLNETDFGSTPATGEFEFRLDAEFVYSNNGSPIYFPISTTSAIPGPDVSFYDCNCCSGCCPDHQVVTEEVPINLLHTKQAEHTLIAKNKINNNAIASYHAGDWVLLSPPFHSVSGSRMIAYLEGCAEFYQYKQNQNTVVNNSKSVFNRELIALEKIESGNVESTLFIYPNPTNNIINIYSSADVIENVTITDMNGRIVKNITLGVNEGQINIVDLSQGVYILNAVSNGKSVTEKIIKR